MNKIECSIIIVNYKTPRLVVKCVNSIIEKTHDIIYEIIVVDNNSEDNSILILKEELGKKIILIESKENLGFGKANNLGVKYSSGEYILFLNSDTFLVNDAVNILYNFLKSKKKVGIVGGNLYTLDMHPSPSFSVNYDNLETEKKESRWTNIFRKIIRNKAINKFRITNQLNTFNYTDNNMEVAYIFGTDMMLSREVFLLVDGFDPSFFMYAEEEDLSYRISKLGYKHFSVPQAKVVHYDGASTKRINEFNSKQFKMRIEGKFIYYNNHYGYQGVKNYYKYKSLYFNRCIKIATLFNRKQLLEITTEQLNCLKEVYKNIEKRYKCYGRNI